MAFSLLLLFAFFMDNTGLCAETVFVKTGASVQLDIQTQDIPQFYTLVWSKDKSDNIITYLINAKVEPHISYKDRVDFNTTSFSLILKNMQKNESGLYTAQARGQSDKTIATHRLSVIDEVEDPSLAVNSSWSSPDSCGFTCTGSNSSASSIFTGSSCSPQEVTSADNNTLRLSCSDDSIVCNYSNPVSSKTKVKKVPEHCSAEKGKLISQASVFPSWIIVCLLIVLVAGTSFCIYKRTKGTKCENEQTIYAIVDENSKSQDKLEQLENLKNTSTVYDTVRDSGQTDDTDHITPSDDPLDQSASLTEKSKPNGPVTIYSTVQTHPDPRTTETDLTIYAQVKKPAYDHLI